MHNILLYNKVSLLFLLGAIAYGVMTVGNLSAVVTLILSLATVFLVKSSQEKDSVRYTYMAGFTLTLAAMVWPYVIVTLLLFLCFLVKPLEVITLRNVMSMLLGVLSPLWLYLPVWLYGHVMAMDWECVREHYMGYLTSVEVFDYGEVTVFQAAICGVLLLLFLGLIVRRSSYRFKGKLFVRRQRAVYITMVWAVALVMIVLPSLSNWLLPLMATFMGPVAAQVVMGDGR